MAKKNNKTTNQNLKDEYKKKYASSKELSDASKSDMSRASSIIPASALYESIRRSEKRMSSNGESGKNIQPIRGIIDWTNGSTQGWDLLTSQSLPTPSFVGLLDTYGGAAAAYSLRKLSSTYEGSAIRVRESSGNTELDVGFDVNGDLDTTALLAHCGVNDGFVTTWYDQSGNARNAINVTAGNQPQIVSTGIVVTKDGLPAISHSSQFLHAGTSAIIDTGFSSFAVTSSNLTNNMSPYAKALAGGSVNRVGITVTDAFCSDSSNNVSKIVLSSAIGVNYLLNQIIDNSPNMSYSLYRNNTQVGVTTTTAAPISSNTYELLIGAYNNNLGGFSPPSRIHNGTIQEIIIYGSGQGANRDAINIDINSYYSIY